MKITNIEIKNFRLFKDASLSLENDLTLLVGKNNSGKTSLIEILEKFLSVEKIDRHFYYEDFSGQCQQEIKSAFNNSVTSSKRENLNFPSISLTLTFQYDQHTEASRLDGFILNLDPDCNTFKVEFELSINPSKFYEVFDYEGLQKMPNEESGDKEKRALAFFNQRIRFLYLCTEKKITVVDTLNKDNRAETNLKEINKILKFDCMPAQRTFSEGRKSLNSSQKIGKVIQDIYRLESKKNFKKDSVRKLIEALEKAESNLNDSDLTLLTNFKKVLNAYGQPGVNELELDSRFHLDPDKLLEDFTETSYKDTNSNLRLPETYSGLGTRNLTHILLEKEKIKLERELYFSDSLLHIICIEEPEAHLHPQLQEVFIRTIKKENEETEEREKNLQFIVTTHSSHILNAASLAAARYCRIFSGDSFVGLFRHSQFVELKDIDQSISRYITLTKCDLLFADKAILFEGGAEAILIPHFIEKASPELARQYISFIEVGGRYADKFFELLNKLGIRSLVITDIDPVILDKAISNRYKSCICSISGAITSNPIIKAWFSCDPCFIEEISSATDTMKEKGNLRIATQLSKAQSDAPCMGSTLEDDIILSNPEIFKKELQEGKKILSSLNDPVEINRYGVNNTDKDLQLQAQAYAYIHNHSFKKIDFALKILKLENLVVPPYIQEGLEWLAQNE
ncbi:AAA family ATPase [uncultured Turicimonas sp.]|uniref:AAA family ATPase n=1 Tax=uncultured Turicimonas sp. TaxID=1918607 RepID=UPI003211AF3B